LYCPTIMLYDASQVVDICFHVGYGVQSIHVLNVHTIMRVLHTIVTTTDIVMYFRVGDYV
jgi:hypothetical protein